MFYTTTLFVKGFLEQQDYYRSEIVLAHRNTYKWLYTSNVQLILRIIQKTKFMKDNRTETFLLV